LANIASAKKRVRQATKRTLQNNKYRHEIRYHVKKFTEALASADSDNIQASLLKAVKVIDKAASKGVIHKNAAARKKSSLYKRLSESNVAS